MIIHIISSPSPPPPADADKVHRFCIVALDSHFDIKGGRGPILRQTAMSQPMPMNFFLLPLVGLLLSASFPDSTIAAAFTTFSPSSASSFTYHESKITTMLRYQRMHKSSSTPSSRRNSLSTLKMMANNSSLDPVTYLRTEWVSAALVANQTPRVADRVLQLGVGDGRIVNFVPRTVREIITSSAESKDGPEGGGLTVSAERQLKQMVSGIRFRCQVVLLQVRVCLTLTRSCILC